MGRKPESKDKKKEFGIQLFSARTKMEINQRELVKKMKGITPGMYSNYERGLRMPKKPEILQELKNVLGVSIPDEEEVLILNGHSDRDPGIEVMGELLCEGGIGRVEWAKVRILQLDLSKVLLLEQMSNIGNQVVGVRVNGHEFLPDYKNGDILLVELTENRREILRDDHVIVKRKGEEDNLFLRYDVRKKALVGLSAGDRDQVFVFPKGTMELVGRVVSMWRRNPSKG